MDNFFGVFTSVVVDNLDPDNLGRVKVRVAAVEDKYEVWARLATLVAGNERGSWFIPEVDDEVLVAFEGGDPRRCFVIGSLWSDGSTPPEGINPLNDRKVLRLRSGLQITLSEQNGKESIELETPGGQSLTLKDGPGAIEISDSNGNVLALETRGITIHATAKVVVSASSVDVNAGMLNVKAPFAKFDGVIVCNTLVSTNVVSANYTPGAGNVW